MLFDLRNIKDIVNIVRILIWAGFVIVVLCLVFELLIVGKSHISHIFKKDEEGNSIISGLYIAFGYILFCIFWIVDIKPFKSVWRFLVALIPFLLLLSPIFLVIYLIWSQKLV